MPNTRRGLLINALKLFDLLLMSISFLLASLVILHQQQGVSTDAFFSMRVKVQNFAIFSVFLLLWHVIFSWSGLYRSRRLSSVGRDVIDLITANSLGVLAMLVGALMFRIKMVTALFVVVFWLTAACTSVPSRLMLRAFLGVLRKRGRNLRSILIIGTNSRALGFARGLLFRRELGYEIIGFADRDWDGLEAFRRSGYKLVADIDGLPQYLRNSVVDEVVIALPFRSMHEQASRIATCCEEQGITVHVLTSILDVKMTRPSAGELEGDALITHSAGCVDDWPLFAKRVVDLVVSFIAVVVLFPILISVAILIKLTSPGPILFVQRRVGLHKRPFKLYKFRSMVIDAEKRMREVEALNEVRGPVFKIKNDPRITSTGRILRKTSIDEFPQLFNVLKGEMSLVGPRPLPVRDYAGFSKDWQRRRFSVKPGITCLWQVNGRNSIPFEQWMEMDLQYIDRWSLWLDFQILLQTIPAVLKGSGAA
jgi:exopolysaccharide biosynthesis polyprenyl glycosylphosphotransferase